jgi:hypothetical protein
VNIVLCPESRVTDVGLISTEEILTVGGGVEATEMCTGRLCSVALSKDALTKRVTFPSDVPAVNSTGSPVLELSVPVTALVRDHTYWIPDGQAAVHAGLAVKTLVPVSARLAEVGATETDLSGELGVIVMVTGPPCSVTPSSDAFTKSARVPVVDPAVNSTGLEVLELSVPIDGLLRAHAYVAPEGHVALQAREAVMALVV